MFGARREPPPSTWAIARASIEAPWRRVQKAIAGDARARALRETLRRSYALYKRALVKRPELRRFRRDLPRWIATRARLRAWAMDDDCATAFVLAAPFALMFLVWIAVMFVRWLDGRDRNDALNAVFDAARRRKAREAAAKALPNQAPAAIDRTQSGREVTMTPKDLESLRKFREKLNAAAAENSDLLGTPALRAYVDDACLCRYLRARKWNVDKALKMIIASLQWRATMKPEALTWDDIADEALTGKQYRSGRDKRGRRVLVMRPDRENSYNHVENIKFLVYTLENILWKSSREREPRGSKADLAPEQIVILINFTDWSRKNAVPMATARETLSILQNHYPERLGLAVCFNPPTIFRVFWSIISPFIDPKTYSKIVFVNKKKKEKAAATMGAVFHSSAVDDDMGGVVPSAWNFDVYATHMRDYDAKKAIVMASWP